MSDLFVEHFALLAHGGAPHWHGGRTKSFLSAMFDGVRKAWLETGLIEHKRGYPGMLAVGNPRGKLTRYRATPKLLGIAAGYGITPDNVAEHFKFEFTMPVELVQLSRPFHLTPNTERVGKRASRT